MKAFFLGKNKTLSYEGRRRLRGYLFISPWLIGLLLMFLIPLVQSVLYSVSDLEFLSGSIKLNFIGFSKYVKVFTEDGKALKLLFSSLGGILLDTVYITVFSLFIAVVLSQEFSGRMLARAVFFMPVIVTSGVIISIIRGDSVSSQMFSGDRSSAMLKSVELSDILLKAGYSSEMVGMLTGLIDNLFDLVWKSGVQILLVLAGLQGISPALYESSSMDGATGWEVFWFITLPMITPILLLTTVYTIIDGLSDYSNQYQKLALSYAQQLDYSYSSVLVCLYFAATMLLLGIVFLVAKRRFDDAL